MINEKEKIYPIVDTELTPSEYISVVNNFTEMILKDNKFAPHLAFGNAIGVFMEKCIKNKEFIDEYISDGIIDNDVFDCLMSFEAIRKSYLSPWVDGILFDSDKSLCFERAVIEAQRIAEERFKSPLFAVQNVLNLFQETMESISSSLDPNTLKELKEITGRLTETNTFQEAAEAYLLHDSFQGTVKNQKQEIEKEMNEHIESINKGLAN